MIKPLGDAPDHWRVMDAFFRCFFIGIAGRRCYYPTTAEIAALVPHPEPSLDWLCGNKYLRRLKNDRWTYLSRAKFVELEFYQTIWPNLVEEDISLALNLVKFVEEEGHNFAKCVIHNNRKMGLEAFLPMISEDDRVLWRLWLTPERLVNF